MKHDEEVHRHRARLRGQALADGGRAAQQHDAAEYKHVVLGLIFLKYISDAFEAKHAALEAERKQGADPEDPDEYRASNIFWVPKEARWAHLKASAPQPKIGQIVDEAMAAIERDNPSPKGVLVERPLCRRAERPKTSINPDFGSLDSIFWCVNPMPDTNEPVTRGWRGPC